MQSEQRSFSSPPPSALRAAAGGFFLAMTFLLPACATERPAAERAVTHSRAAPAITHVVLISLQDPSQADALMRDCRAALPRIPSVELFGCGPHVDIGRANIDGDYDVGIVVGFASVHDYGDYLTHPLHEELVAKWRPRWRTARIFDVGNDLAPHATTVQ